VDEKELDDLTRKTAALLLGDQQAKEDRPYALWREFDPQLAKEFSRFFVGRMYARSVLSQRERELCAVGALVMGHFWDELYIHCHAALNVGATREEVAEVIFQMTTYGGVPSTVEGLRVLKKVLQARGEWEPRAPPPRKADA
jgi:4-carboxymuconolactone decarboxylase